MRNNNNKNQFNNWNQFSSLKSKTPVQQSFFSSPTSTASTTPVQAILPQVINPPHPIPTEQIIAAPIIIAA